MADSAPQERPGAPRPADLLFSAIVFVIALLPRLYVAIAWAREPVWDGHYYDFGARRIAAGLGYSDDVVIGGHAVWHPWCHYPVGYSGFLGLIYRVFGHAQIVAPVANAVTGALLAVVAHRLALRATSLVRARIAALLVALSPGLIVYAALLMTEPLAGLGILTAGWLFARDASIRPLRGAITAGIALGLTALVRPQSLLCAPALGLMAFLMTPRSALPSKAIARGLAVTCLSLASSLVVVLPWSIRNCRVMDGCALVSTNGGWNLAIGSFPRATGRFETLRGTDGCPVVTGQVQQDRCWRDEGVRWILADPWRWIRLMPKKLAYTFDHESFPMGYLGEANPKDWPPEDRATGRAVLSVSHGILLVLAALGLVARPLSSRSFSWRGLIASLGALALIVYLAYQAVYGPERALWPIALAIPILAALPLPGARGRAPRGGVIAYLAFAVASVIVTHAVFFGEDRYHMVVTPVVCILAACALRRPDDRPAICVMG